MKVHLKMNSLECSQHFSHFKCMGNLSNVQGHSPDPGPILPNFEPIEYLIAGLFTSKNEDNPIINEGVRVLTRLYMEFSNAQEQVT